MPSSEALDSHPRKSNRESFFFHSKGDAPTRTHRHSSREGRPRESLNERIPDAASPVSPNARALPRSGRGPVEGVR